MSGKTEKIIRRASSESTLHWCKLWRRRSRRHVPSTRIQILLLLASIALSGVIFITLDYSYSTLALKASFRKLAVQRARINSTGNCRLRDSLREHALRPNCAAVDLWGDHTYEFFTNSLAFRDERIREVTATDTRPRLLFLGDSFTEGKAAWGDSFVGRIAAHFPQYDFLNGGLSSYSPSNYLNVSLTLLETGVQLDEVIVFVDISDAQDEAAYYRDVGVGNAVRGPERTQLSATPYSNLRAWMNTHLLLISHTLEVYERNSILRGHYLPVSGYNLFDSERSAWTYRKVSDTKRYDSGYAPLGLEGGIARESQKMNQLWQALVVRHIPISVVVYPWPAQIAHDTEDSREVRIWRDWCEGKCKRFISLFPAFLAAKRQCSQSKPGCWYPSLFIYGDVHFNSAGNALMSSAVIQSLEAAPPEKVPHSSANPKLSVKYHQ